MEIDQILEIEKLLKQPEKILEKTQCGDKLECRESEYSEIHSSLSHFLKKKKSLSLYISGIPGTGKTATVSLVIGNLQNKNSKSKQNSFNSLEINGLRLSNLSEPYLLLYDELFSKKCARSKVLEKLEMFYKDEASKKKPTIVVLDEIDQMLNKKQDLLYNFFSWTTYKNSNLAIIAISNTMDLPERLSTKNQSRLGLHRITFQPYNYTQLTKIMEKLLIENLKCGFFDRTAIEFGARKISSVSGDIRRYFDLMRRVVQKKKLDTKIRIDIALVDEVYREMFVSSTVKIIQKLSLYQKKVLVCVYKSTRASEETNIHNILSRLYELENFYKNDLQKSTTAEIFLHALYVLSASKLILVEGDGISSKTMLNVCTKDLTDAFKADETVSLWLK